MWRFFLLFILDWVCRAVCGVRIHVCVYVRTQELCLKGLSYQSFSDALQPVLKHASCLNRPSVSHTHSLKLCSMLTHTPLNNQSRLTVVKGYCYLFISVALPTEHRSNTAWFISVMQIQTSLLMPQSFHISSELQTTEVLANTKTKQKIRAAKDAYITR